MLPNRPLAESFAQFWKTLEACTIPCDGGRSIPDAFGAIKLSESAGELYQALAAAHRVIFAKHGREPVNLPVKIQLHESDSPDGPWTPVSDESIKASVVTVGSDGADAGVMAAIDRATKVVAFPIERQGDKRRYRVGEIIPDAQLEMLKSVERLLALVVPVDPPAQANIELDKPRQRIRIGESWHDVTEAQFEMVEKLYQADGAWVTGNRLKAGPDSRPDKIRKGMPHPIQEIIDTHPANGYRLKPDILRP